MLDNKHLMNGAYPVYMRESWLWPCVQTSLRWVFTYDLGQDSPTQTSCLGPWLPFYRSCDRYFFLYITFRKYSYLSSLYASICLFIFKKCSILYFSHIWQQPFWSEFHRFCGLKNNGVMWISWKSTTTPYKCILWINHSRQHDRVKVFEFMILSTYF